MSLSLWLDMRVLFDDNEPDCRLSGPHEGNIGMTSLSGLSLSVCVCVQIYPTEREKGLHTEVNLKNCVLSGGSELRRY